METEDWNTTKVNFELPHQATSVLRVSQDCMRLHCKETPTKGSKRTWQLPAMKGGKGNNTQGPFFPSTQEDDSNLSNTTTLSLFT